MTPEPISTLHFINPSHQMSLYVRLLIAARQRLAKNVTVTWATETQQTTYELLYSSFSMRVVHYQRKVGA
jgi:hypothetical protein